MQRYSIEGREVAGEDDTFAGLVALAYAQRARAYCRCRRDEELPLYISLRHGSHVLSRYPGTGPRHAPQCDHYAAPDWLTGLGQVRGHAVVEDADTGDVSLKFEFPLSRGAARASPTSLINDKAVVKSTGQRLSMRGFLHYLWDKAELTHWHPRMADKRNWFVVRRALFAAALSCRARGEVLSHLLFIPETLNVERKDEIRERRASELQACYASREAIMLVIGEVKSIDKARYGETIVLKHLPDWPLGLDVDMARRFHKRFASEEKLWNGLGGAGHLVLAATFSIGEEGYPGIIEATVMPVTREWMPFEKLEERHLIEKAVKDRRRFVKGLRVNLGKEVPIAALSLTDTGSTATAVFLAGNRVDDAYDEALAELMRTPGVEHVLWKSGSLLPAAQGRAAAKPQRLGMTIS